MNRFKKYIPKIGITFKKDIGPVDKTNPLTPEEIAKTRPKSLVPPARSTEPPQPKTISPYKFENDSTLVEPGFQFEIIPLIRKLALGNQSVSQALTNIINLANTGHRVVFDESVPLAKANEMRKHRSE